MGIATRKRREAFFQKNPHCVFCGGGTPATTVEHCPPRAMFQNRHWPEGFEFPSCDNCNHGTADHDLLVSMIARMDPFTEAGDRDGKLNGLMHGVHKQFPGLLQKMLPSAVEARRSNREFGISPDPGQTHQEVGVVNVTDEMREAVCVFARKLAKGTYYLHTQQSFPNEGCLLLKWFTNSDLLLDGRYTTFDLLQHMAGEVPPIQRSGRYLGDQFEYKLSLSPDSDILALQAIFGKAFGLVIFGCTIPGKLEASIERLREQNQNDGPFAVLQSRSLRNQIE